VIRNLRIYVEKKVAQIIACGIFESVFRPAHNLEFVILQRAICTYLKMPNGELKI